MTFTTSHAGEWDHVLPAERATSHRSTTSSRHPGRTFEGAVTYVVKRVVRCALCGLFRRDDGGLHAWWWGKDAEGRPIRVRCDGRELTKQETEEVR